MSIRVKRTITDKELELRKYAWYTAMNVSAKECEVCRRTCEDTKLYRHHPDYTKPEIVQVLCGKCHSKAHKNLNNGWVGAKKERKKKEKKVTETLERTDRLRKRPETIRYYFLAVGLKNVHIGLSHAGLQKAAKGDTVTAVFVADVVTKNVQKVTLERFLVEWREHYQDPTWEYKE